MEKIWARKRQQSCRKIVLNSLGHQWPVVVKGLRLINPFEKRNLLEGLIFCTFTFTNFTCKVYWGCHFKALHTAKNEVFHYGFLQLMWSNPKEIADLVTLTEEILNGKLFFFFLCSDRCYQYLMFDTAVCILNTLQEVYS